jgi:nucleotide-binding universal stress UspA family protein
MNVETAREDLQVHLDELDQAGFQATAEIVRRDPIIEIVNISENLNADLIVLTTHRKAGASAFWAGSVAPNVVRRTRLPILLIPLKDK